MGATPLGITVGLSLPPTLPVVWLEQLYAGMQACLERYGTGIVGGDLTRSPTVTIAITALGTVTTDRVIARSTAQIDEAIVVTGYHGDSHAGLQLLLDPQLGPGLDEFTDSETWQVHRQQLITAHQRPQPRLDLLPILDRLRANTSQILTISGMDSSDGLADAVSQICRASHVGAILNRADLPISPALAQIFPATAVASALYGGEDFELVLCLPAAIARDLVMNIGQGATIVGKITRSPEMILVDATGQHQPITIDSQSGFKHF